MQTGGVELLLNVHPTTVDKLQQSKPNKRFPVSAVPTVSNKASMNQLAYLSRKQKYNIEQLVNPSSRNVVTKLPKFKNNVQNNIVLLIDKAISELEYTFKNDLLNFQKLQISGDNGALKLYMLGKCYTVIEFLKIQKLCIIEYSNIKTDKIVYGGASARDIIARYFLSIQPKEPRPGRESWDINDRIEYLMSRYVLYFWYTKELFEGDKLNKDGLLPAWLEGEEDSQGNLIMEYEFHHFLIYRIYTLSTHIILKKSGIPLD
jgi:hypothetical protein